MGQAGDQSEQAEKCSRDADCLRLRHHLGADVFSKVRIAFFRGNAGNNHAGCNRDQQCGDLRNQSFADCQNCVFLHR